MQIPDDVLLAKSHLHGRIVTLADHARDVLEAVVTMFGTAEEPTRLARAWLRTFRLPEEMHVRFFRTLWVAAALHDLGKANQGFQNAVRRGSSQTIRHEHLSALLLGQEPLWGWLQRMTVAGVDAEVVLSAVVSHHLKVHDGSVKRELRDALFTLGACRSTAEDASEYVLLDHPDVTVTLLRAAAAAGIEPPSMQGHTGRWRCAHEIGTARNAVEDAFDSFDRDLDRNDQRRRLLLAVKAGVIAADSAGSALPRLGLSTSAWLADTFGGPPLTSKTICGLVIRPRIRSLQQRHVWRGFHQFQRAAAELGPRTLLLSGCGTGKTLAAWLWAAAQAKRRPVRRVLFLYPTRATATEGFRDYVSWAGPEDAALLSGTAPYDIQGMFSNDPREGQDYGVTERLFALGYWPRRIFSATVDSFLALMANQYAPLCMMPLLAESVVIVDEVHSFSKSMFRALEGFLRFFDIPVLCMTASLTSDRLRVLHEGCGMEIFPDDPSAFEDLQAQSKASRYRVRVITEDEAATTALAAAQAGLRVMWVVNTVDRCQEKAKWLRDQEQLGPDRILCYHSRFRLVDRKERHEEVIERFKDDAERPLVLVTTQVCEMSLDLDADVLISEFADPPSLIQRMGRCNREQHPRPEPTGRVYLYAPPGNLPYKHVDIDAGQRFAAKWHDRDDVSQLDLAHYLEGLELDDPVFAGGYNGFTDSGPYAYSRDDQFREDRDFTVDCVLDQDLVDFLAAREQRSPGAGGYIVPVPGRDAQRDERLPQWLSVAPGRYYGQSLGFQSPGGTYRG
ncbi:MAG: CRISPR-associated helicase Cas3' [Dehalococcoidia bacterium]